MKSIYNKEEKELVKQCLDGNGAAQKMLYQRYSRKMFGICMGYAKDYDMAKDLLQEGFIKVFQKLSKFEGNGSLEGWVRRTIVNNNIDIFRSNARKGTFLNLEDEQGNTIDGLVPTINNDALRKIEIDEFLRMTQGLPEGYRMILNLHIVEELTHKEIGEKLGISEGTSKSNLSRARRILQEKVRNHYYSSVKTVV